MPSTIQLMRATRHIVLYSGGPDSHITYVWVKENMEGEVIPAYAPLGHRYQCEEEMAIGRIMRGSENSVRLLSGLEQLGRIEQVDAHIPNRNVHLVLAAVSLVTDSPAKIWLTVQQDEMSIPDRSLEFMRQMSILLRTLGVRADVMTPWAGMDKTDMFQWYKWSGHSMAELKATHSCYTPGSGHCGSCPACLRRFIAMKLSYEKEDYRNDPMKSFVAEEYRDRARAGEFSEKRTSRIREALGL